MKLFKSFQKANLAAFIGKELWVLCGEYAHGVSYYARILDANDRYVTMNLVPAMDVDDNFRRYSSNTLDHVYNIPLDEMWVDFEDVLTTEEIKDAVLEP